MKLYHIEEAGNAMFWLCIAKSEVEAKLVIIEAWKKEMYEDQTELDFAQRLVKVDEMNLTDDRGFLEGDDTRSIVLGLYSGDDFFKFMNAEGNNWLKD